MPTFTEGVEQQLAQLADLQLQLNERSSQARQVRVAVEEQSGLTDAAGRTVIEAMQSAVVTMAKAQAEVREVGPQVAGELNAQLTVVEEASTRLLGDELQTMQASMDALRERAAVLIATLAQLETDVVGRIRQAKEDTQGVIDGYAALLTETATFITADFIPRVAQAETRLETRRTELSRRVAAFEGGLDEVQRPLLKAMTDGVAAFDTVTDKADKRFTEIVQGRQKELSDLADDCFDPVVDSATRMARDLESTVELLQDPRQTLEKAATSLSDMVPPTKSNLDKLVTIPQNLQIALKKARVLE